MLSNLLKLYRSVLLVLGVGIGASLPKEGRVHSKYVQLLEGRREEH